MSGVRACVRGVRCAAGGAGYAQCRAARRARRPPAASGGTVPSSRSRVPPSADRARQQPSDNGHSNSNSKLTRSSVTPVPRQHVLVSSGRAARQAGFGVSAHPSTCLSLGGRPA